jgi:hypothetical protein
MRKASVLIIIVLIVILSGTVAWHWIAFTKKTADVEPESEEKITLAVTVKVDQAGMNIKQVFSNINDNKKYEAIIPSQAADVNCLYEDGTPCLDELQSPSIKVKGTKLQFEYIIKSDPGVALLLNDWLVILKDINITETRVEIVDQLRRKGTWVAGLPLKGYKQMEAVNYYVFEGMSKNPSLYWQERSLAKLTGQRGIDYYTFSKEQAVYQFDSLKNFTMNQHLSVIMHDGNRVVHGNGILLAGNKLTDKDFEQQLAIAFLSSKFDPLAKIDSWILESLASLVTNQDPENTKSQAIVSELKVTLTAAELNKFITSFSSDSSTIGHLSLDEYLSAIKGLKTSFFSLNMQEGSGVFPLLFMDTRSVEVNGNDREEIDVVIKGDKKLFPLAPTMDALGFKTKLGSDMKSLEILSASSTYSFNLENKTFIHNGQSFGLLENPFQNFNGNFYLEKHWLNAIFKVSVKENEDNIIVSF